MHGQAAIPQSTLETPRHSSRRGIASLLIITFLCLPSLIGASALGVQLLLHQDMSHWNATASALIAQGALFGLPLVGVAAVVGAIVALTCVPPRIKYADLFIVTLASLASLSLLIRFAK